MGFGFRKSIKIGPARINLSKSGIGASIGVPGARITKRANGKTQTTLGIPGTGLYYTSQSSTSKKQPTKKEQEQQILAEHKKNADGFLDLLPYDSLKDKILFLVIWNTVKMKYAEEASLSKGSTVEVNLLDITNTTFKLADVNAMNAKLDGEETTKYTSNHLIKMLEKGWLERPSRGVYKINYKILAPAVMELNHE